MERSIEVDTRKEAFWPNRTDVTSPVCDAKVAIPSQDLVENTLRGGRRGPAVGGCQVPCHEPTYASPLPKPPKRTDLAGTNNEKSTHTLPPKSHLPLFQHEQARTLSFFPTRTHTHMHARTRTHRGTECPVPMPPGSCLSCRSPGRTPGPPYQCCGSC